MVDKMIRENITLTSISQHLIRIGYVCGSNSEIVGNLIQLKITKYKSSCSLLLAVPQNQFNLKPRQTTHSALTHHKLWRHAFKFMFKFLTFVHTILQMKIPYTVFTFFIPELYNPWHNVRNLGPCLIFSFQVASKIDLTFLVLWCV